MAQARVSQSAVTSLKAIFSILMGLSVTNTFVVVILHQGEGDVSSLAQIDWMQAVFAAALLFTIARFYLGNVRHVDDFYVAEMVDGKALDPRDNSASRFVVDFIVLLIQALMFSLASFYVVHAANFIEIVLALLAVDILWTVVTRGVAPHSDFWFLNNLLHLLAIAICFDLHLKHEGNSTFLYLAIAFLITNGLFDFAWNRHFYFSDRAHDKGIFLSAPFTQLLTDRGLPPQMRQRLGALIDHLEAQGWSVGNAHKREGWGHNLDSPYSALTADLEGIDAAGIMVAILGSPPSPGVQLEIGFAIARHKKLILIADQAERMPYLIRGLVEQDSVLLIQERAPMSDYELGQAISSALRHLGG